MKRATILIALVAILTSSPVWAQGQETWQEKLKKQLRNEDVTQAIGAIAGALLGTQIGGGRGKLAAIAVGTFAGYWLAGKFTEKLNDKDRIGIAETTERAIRSGQTTTWRNPDTGMHTRVSVSDARSGHSDPRERNKKPPLNQLPPVELVNSYYVPTVNTNVRAGPGTQYQILSTIKKGTPAPIVGRVVDKKWLMLVEAGTAAGFVYAPLMKLSDDQSQLGNAIRDSLSRGSEMVLYQVEAQDCKRVAQEVTLRDGTTDSHSFKLCQQADGSWVEV